LGAGLTYGPVALQTATAVKLSRTLWIVPLTLAFAVSLGRKKSVGAHILDEGSRWAKNAKITIPWFIGYFLLASLMRSYVPIISMWSPQISEIAHRGMILVLFLVRALRVVGWRTVVVGLILWIFISTISLLAILLLKLAT